MWEGMSFWEVIAADANRVGGRINPHASYLPRHWHAYKLRKFRPSFACVFWLRVNERIAGKRGSVRLRNWRQYRFANDISEFATIGPGLWLPHLVDVTIGSAVVIGKNATIFNGVTIGGKGFTPIGGELGAMPTLGKNVIVYTGAKVVGGITIGDDVEIGALALCNKNVPARSVMYGIPPNVTIKSKEKPSPDVR